MAKYTEESLDRAMFDHDNVVNYTVGTFRQPKKIAEIVLCGAVKLEITDTIDNFIRPTEEQIKNLHDLFCIDVRLFD